MENGLKFLEKKWDVVIQDLPSFIRSLGVGFTRQGNSKYLFLALWYKQVLIGRFERVAEEYAKDE